MATVLLERDFSLHGGRHSADSKIHPPPQPEFPCLEQGGPPPAPAPARPPSCMAASRAQPASACPSVGLGESRGDTQNLPAHWLSWLTLVLPSMLPRTPDPCRGFQVYLGCHLRTGREAAEMVEAVLPRCPGVRHEDRMQLDLSSYNTLAFRASDTHTCIPALCLGLICPHYSR